ncbi:hypothetical protein TNCV_3589331 [Trichonephila clavipes]|nr:hypothetical protein TNCV_3589331 [Trichonephila clavipes]
MLKNDRFRRENIDCTLTEFYATVLGKSEFRFSGEKNPTCLCFKVAATGSLHKPRRTRHIAGRASTLPASRRTDRKRRGLSHRSAGLP